MAEDQLLPQGIFALVDSTVPHLWLPLSVCQAFEDALGLQYDPITTLYLVNDTQHAALIQQNAEVSFLLAAGPNGGPVVNITLPYASLDLEAGPPLVKSQNRYFPLRRAKDETQFTLGRVLLQEAFIIVDFDHGNFSISKAQYSDGTPSHIVATSSTPGTETANTNSNSTTSDNPVLVKSTSHTSKGISTGAIAGIVIALVLLVLVAVGFFFWRHKSRKSRSDKKSRDTAELDGNVKPEGIYEAYGKSPLPEGSVHETKKGTSFGVNEAVQTPPPDPVAAELEGVTPGGTSRAQMSPDEPVTAELPSPDPFRPELAGGFLRSELSTPDLPASELSTSDPSLVPELTSRDMPHELSGSNRNSHVRPNSFRNDSFDSDIISPHDSASIRPTIHRRKGSSDTIPTPFSPQPQRPSLRQAHQRHSGFQRSHHGRLHSQSSHDTFQTRINETSTPQQNQQGAPSPLTSPPLGGQPSPSLSALNSPTIPHQQMSYPGLPTPGLDIGEREPLISPQRQQAFRGTRFSENLPPETMTRDERQMSEDATSVEVKEQVERLENLKK
ncbi:MAG: hypothetical protein Q9170_006195 [Blastenia crenularia]